MDTFVWVREKQPAMFVRNKIRNYLVSREHDIESMVKSTLVDCWGKDIY